ncbi:McrC family protein [Lacticaseibacillus sharpeae]|uniref:5-methylcytosine-specific restriction enzyme subunit McrC n=1 Tax=Lacticaseibacillus sharpeae JCM 1186 = DSM 20505 TaxID=1291052 RepID=A0A0R1ZUA0_9LACO|nr:hypothetical protein [Lacticaseibacillus sharpeae]KRM55675.1 hypothetical protein FC18_GL001046 [Lacticaseibacillus sharpeae JCM 1186 = DSM 20505]
MTNLRIKDNTVYPWTLFQAVPQLTAALTNQSLAQLVAQGLFVFPNSINQSPDLTADQFVLRSVNRSFQSSNVMGFIGLGQEQLVIGSRFGQKNADYFLHYMLSHVLEFPNVVNLDADTDESQHLFDLLVYVFPQYLKAALRKGVFKTYIRREYNDANVKGTIDIARHLQQNTPFLGKIAYSQREFVYDNYLMELVRHTIEFIKQRQYGRALLAPVQNEVAQVIHTTAGYERFARRQVIIKNQDNPVRHAYYSEYRVLQRLCLMILQHQKQQFGSGSSQLHGILFDGAWLWEEYVNQLIGKWYFHPMNKGGRGAQQLFTGDTGQLGLIYPDFIGRNAQNRVIADTKYKPVGNIGGRDYLQVVAYMFRFDARTAFYLYPEQSELEDTVLKLNQGISYEQNVSPRTDIQLIKCGLSIPQRAANYDDFVGKMHKNESEFLTRIQCMVHQ